MTTKRTVKVTLTVMELRDAIRDYLNARLREDKRDWNMVSVHINGVPLEDYINFVSIEFEETPALPPPPEPPPNVWSKVR